MSIKIDLARLREQTTKMKTQMPELFDYLCQRDQATAAMVQTIAHSIPNPDDLPQIEIPFIDAVIELSQAKKRCPICDPPDPDDLWVLGPKVRAKLCHYCLNGIYLRGTGVEGLAAG